MLNFVWNTLYHIRNLVWARVPVSYILLMRGPILLVVMPVCVFTCFSHTSGLALLFTIGTI